MVSDIEKKFQEEYLNTIPTKIENLTKLTDALKKDITTDTLHALRLQVHKIAGSAGTYGFPDISALARKFEENILQKMEQMKASSPKPEWVEEFSLLLDQLKSELISASRH